MSSSSVENPRGDAEVARDDADDADDPSDAAEAPRDEAADASDRGDASSLPGGVDRAAEIAT